MIDKTPEQIVALAKQHAFITYDGKLVFSPASVAAFASALTAAQPAGPTVHIEGCNFQGKNKDGSEPFTYRVRADGFSEIEAIRLVGWNCQGPAPIAQPAQPAQGLTNKSVSDAELEKALSDHVDALVNRYPSAMRYVLEQFLVSRAAQPVPPAAPEIVAWRREWNGDVSDENNWLFASSEEEKDSLTWEALVRLSDVIAQPAERSFAKLYKDNAQGIEIERLKMRIEELEAQPAALPVPYQVTDEDAKSACIELGLSYSMTNRLKEALVAYENRKAAARSKS